MPPEIIIPLKIDEESSKCILPTFLFTKISNGGEVQDIVIKNALFDD